MMRRFLIAICVFFFAAAAWAQTPQIVSGGILNAASFSKDPNAPVAAGGLVAIFGTHLASQLADADTVPFSATLGGVSVTFNNVPAALRDVIPNATQDSVLGSIDLINAQVPWDVLPAGTSGNVNVVVTRDNVVGPPQTVFIGQYSPGVFTIPPGVGNAVAINYPFDGTLAGPTTANLGYPSRPAFVGDIIIIYATGLGAVRSDDGKAPDTPANGAASTDDLRDVVVPPQVLIGGIPANLVYAVLAPQYPGVYQIAVTIPPGVNGDSVPLQMQAGGVTSTDKATIAVRPKQ